MKWLFVLSLSFLGVVHAVEDSENDLGIIPGEYAANFYKICRTAGKCPALPPKEVIEKDLKDYDAFIEKLPIRFEALTDTFLEIREDLVNMIPKQEKGTNLERVMTSIADDILKQKEARELPNHTVIEFVQMRSYKSRVEYLLNDEVGYNEKEFQLSFLSNFHQEFKSVAKQLSWDKKTWGQNYRINLMKYMDISDYCPSAITDLFSFSYIYNHPVYASYTFEKYMGVMKLLFGSKNVKQLKVRCRQVPLKFLAKFKYNEKKNEIVYNFYSSCNFHGCIEDRATSTEEIGRMLKAVAKKQKL